MNSKELEDYESKYLKYKLKYLLLKGGFCGDITNHYLDSKTQTLESDINLYCIDKNILNPGMKERLNIDDRFILKNNSYYIKIRIIKIIDSKFVSDDDKKFIISSVDQTIYNSKEIASYNDKYRQDYIKDNIQYITREFIKNYAIYFISEDNIKYYFIINKFMLPQYYRFSYRSITNETYTNFVTQINEGLINKLIKKNMFGGYSFKNNLISNINQLQYIGELFIKLVTDDLNNRINTQALINDNKNKERIRNAAGWTDFHPEHLR